MARWSIVQASELCPHAPVLPVLPWGTARARQATPCHRDVEKRGSAGLRALKRLRLRSLEPQSALQPCMCQPQGGSSHSQA